MVPFRVNCTIPTLSKSKAVRRKYCIVLPGEGTFKKRQQAYSYSDTQPFLVGAIHSTKIPTGPTGKRGPPQKVDPFFETFPVGPNRSIEFWTEISGKFG